MARRVVRRRFRPASAVADGNLREPGAFCRKSGNFRERVRATGHRSVRAIFRGRATRPQSCRTGDWHCRPALQRETLMTPATIDAPKVETEPSIRERAVDAARQVARVSREAQLLKSLAADAVEDGVHAAKRTIKCISASRRRGTQRHERRGHLSGEASAFQGAERGSP